MSRIARDTGYITAGHVVQAFIALGLTAATTRILGASGRGEVYYLVQVASLVAVALSLGAGSSIQRSQAAGLIAPRPALRLSNAHLGIAVLVMAAVLGALVWRFPELLPGPIQRHPAGFALLVFGNLALLLIGGLFALREAGFRDTAISGVVASVATLGLLFFAAGRPPEQRVLVAVLAYGVPVALRAGWFDLVLARTSDASHGAGPVRRGVILEGFSLFAGNIAVTLLFRVDALMLEAFRGSAELGTYSVATSLAETALLVPNALGTVLFARMAGAAREAQAGTARIARLTLLLAAGIAVGLLALSDLIILLLAGPQFSSSAVAMRLLLPGVVAMSANYVFYNFLASQGLAWRGVRAFVLGTAVNVVLNWLMLPHLGQYGAAISSSLAYPLTTLLLARSVAGELAVPITTLLVPRSADLRELTNTIRRLRHRVDAPVVEQPAGGNG